MVGLGLAFDLYQNAGPALQAVLILAVVGTWRLGIKPRLDALETVQEERGEHLADAELTRQEHDILLDHAHRRIDDHDDAVADLKERLRGIERAYAVDHGKAPNGFTRGESDGGDDGD